jgi:hypothetical protein
VKICDHAAVSDFDAEPCFFQFLNDFQRRHIDFSIGGEKSHSGTAYSSSPIASSKSSGMKCEYRSVIFSEECPTIFPTL